MLSLAGRTALVTSFGRGIGIGAAIARAYARNGASVAIHDVSEDSKALASFGILPFHSLRSTTV